jgi:uncharacterized 2Fe-2S/4Fe-4S cluster protein (DUF4445 family)
VDVAHKLTALIEAAEKLGIVVRHASLGGEGGGLCRVKGAQVLFVDAMADTHTQYARSLADLAQLPDFDEIYLPPEVRADAQKTE